VVVRLPDQKKKTLGEKGIDCIFVGYAEHPKAYRFYVIEPNDSVSINTIIESRDAIFDENHFSLIPRPKDIIPNSDEFQRDDHSNNVPSDTPESRRGFRPDEGIDYFDTYTPVLRITTIILLLALAAIHNLVIHQMDVKIAFLNSDLKEVYMKQPEGFFMQGNEHKLCKLVKSLYGLKQPPKQWHQKFDEVVFTDQNQVDKTKKFLSLKFSMKDMGESNVILGIKIKHCSSVSTPMDPVEKFMVNIGKPLDQLEYSRAIGCFMYAMTSTRPDIGYVIHLLLVDGCSCLGGGGAISWALKKQTCITDSNMESEFVALSDVDEESEWLRNLIHEIPIWPK
nr:hypothetical protein [Tanacetum cinerariifolium]